jgi:hypothetical protein
MSIAVDLDGTLAHYDEWRGIEHIGSPIPAMIARVRRWLAEGEEVVIHTARVCGGDPRGARVFIEEWLDAHDLPSLRITAEKDWTMSQYWDDRAIGVTQNTGVPRCDTKSLPVWQNLEVLQLD